MLYCTTFADYIEVNNRSLLFAGSTSNSICVWAFKGDEPFQLTRLSSFGTQKGIIFSVDIFQHPYTKSCLIASAAEDRSVVIWSSPFDSFCSMNPSPSGNWCILHRLDAFSNDPTSSLLFGARIWCVCLNDWGIVTAGEDCSIVFYPWLNSSTARLKRVLLKSAHRGRSIWCLDTRIVNETKMQIVSGGNDGGLIANEIDLDVKNEPILNQVISVKPKINIPKSEEHSSLLKHNFPSDVIFLNSQFIADIRVLFPNSVGETVILSSSLRSVFVGPEGKVFTILESGDLALLRSIDDGASELSVIQPMVSSGLVKRLNKGAQYIQGDGVYLRQNCLFPGYCVSGVHRESGRFALGGRWGCLGIYEVEPGES
ncbi:unnamed protein product [Rodentolepis nana]|uniref:WD_REPEATS_REGION domain-containing protein n=1 Tax=Rodentolepis nana TaxID=102285 RepID=A0A158QIC0_RODNA|nr:unnamed protein product [Rodentolepis nana]